MGSSHLAIHISRLTIHNWQSTIHASYLTMHSSQSAITMRILHGNRCSGRFSDPANAHGETSDERNRSSESCEWASSLSSGQCYWLKDRVCFQFWFREAQKRQAELSFDPLCVDGPPCITLVSCLRKI